MCIKEICTICGSAVELTDSYAVNHEGSYTHVCNSCYQGETGLTLCKRCGDSAEYCLIRPNELITYQTSNGDTGYTCQTMIDLGFYDYCSCCGELWPVNEMDYNQCPICEDKENIEYGGFKNDFRKKYKGYKR